MFLTQRKKTVKKQIDESLSGDHMLLVKGQLVQKKPTTTTQQQFDYVTS